MIQINNSTSISTAKLPLQVRNYLTRRIRRQVYGPDIESVLEKQITVPLVIPWDLENYILTQLPQDFQDLPRYVTDHKVLIPVHDTSKYDPNTAILPSLQDVASEKGNIRYWVISNTSMWTGQHRALDETAEILWSLFHWFKHEDSYPNDVGTEAKECLWHVARCCRRRIILPGILSDEGYDYRVSSTPENLIQTVSPTRRERLIFRPWVFHTPAMPDWLREYQDDALFSAHVLFDEDAVLYPFPDELFWNEGDEGEWDGEGAPCWREVEVLDKKKRRRDTDEA